MNSETAGAKVIEAEKAYRALEAERERLLAEATDIDRLIKVAFAADTAWEQWQEAKRELREARQAERREWRNKQAEKIIREDIF